MSPLKEDDIRKVQGLVRKWAAKRKLAQLKSEYLHKLACKFLYEHFWKVLRLMASLLDALRDCHLTSQRNEWAHVNAQSFWTSHAYFCLSLVMRKPTQHGESGPPLFNDVDMMQIY